MHSDYWKDAVTLEEVAELIGNIHAHKLKHAAIQPPLITKGMIYAELRPTKAYLGDDTMVRAWVYCRLLEGFEKRMWDLVQDACHIRVDIRRK